MSARRWWYTHTDQYDDEGELVQDLNAKDPFWLVAPWQVVALWPNIVRTLSIHENAEGEYAIGKYDPVATLVALTRLPEDVVAPAVKWLVEQEMLSVTDGVIALGPDA